MHGAATDRELEDRLLSRVELELQGLTPTQARLFSIGLVEKYPNSDYPKHTLSKLKRAIRSGRKSFPWIGDTELGIRLTLPDAYESSFLVFHQFVVYVKATDYVVAYLNRKKKII